MTETVHHDLTPGADPPPRGRGPVEAPAPMAGWARCLPTLRSPGAATCALAGPRGCLRGTEPLPSTGSSAPASWWGRDSPERRMGRVEGKLTSHPEGSAARPDRVGLLEAAHRALSVGGLLQERFRIPLAAGDAEEVAAVDVDRAGQAWNGIGHRVDDLVPEGRGVLLAQRPRAHRFHLASGAARHAAPEDVVLATRVDPDDGPHSVVVGQQGHPRRPDDVQDGEIAGPVELAELGAPWLSQSAQDRGRLGHRSRDDFADRS